MVYVKMKFIEMIMPLIVTSVSSGLIQCIGFSENYYYNLISQSGFSWICYKCGYSNFDSIISGSGLFTLSNSFTTFDNSLSNSTIVNQDNVLQRSSTPIGVGTERQF